MAEWIVKNVNVDLQPKSVKDQISTVNMVLRETILLQGPWTSRNINQRDQLPQSRKIVAMEIVFQNRRKVEKEAERNCRIGATMIKFQTNYKQL